MTDEETMAVCAIRYAIGRKTYIVSDAVRWARDFGTRSAWVRGVIIKDIEEVAQRVDRGFPGALGMDMDEKLWRGVLAELKALEPPTDQTVEMDAQDDADFR